jgi:hypothetical protein
MAGATPTKTGNKAQLLKAQGIDFIPFDYDYNEEKTATLETLKKYQDDIYAQVFVKISYLIFHSPYTIEIWDLNEKNDEKLAKRFRQMADDPNVNLWKQMKNTWFAVCNPGAYLCSPGLDYLENNFIGLTELRDLPPDTFSQPGTSESVIQAQGEFLKGIVRESDGKIHYYQTQQDGTIQEITNCYHIRSPVYSFDVAGKPLIKVLIKTLNKLGFSWDGVMQANNRAAAPTMFLRVNMRDPQRISKDWLKDDWKMCKDILKAYSRNVLFPIYENIEPIEIKGQVSNIGLDTVDKLAKLFMSAFDPTDIISKGDGSIIGGNSGAEADLYKVFIAGFQQAICDGWTPLFQKILEYNGFKGYKFILKIPEIKFTDGTLNLEQAKELRAAGDCSYNEHRVLCGLEPASKELIKEWASEWKEITPDPIVNKAPGNPMQDDSQAGTGQKTEDDIKAQKLQNNQAVVPTREDIEDELAKDLGNLWTEFIRGVGKVAGVQM